MTLNEPPLSRADLQAQLRKTKKKDQKHVHRWRRRVIWGLSSIVFLGAAGSGGIYFYINYRFDQIHKSHLASLAKQAPPGKPFNILLVGSDSRAFVQNATQQRAFGNSVGQGGQRSDVTMVARFVPATKSVTVLSIPRDLWVDIPGNGNIQGPNRINAAFDVGPDLLIQTIEQVLKVPINHYVSVNFPGFQGMVDALGGITMDFPTRVKDAYSGLNITTTGCQVVTGATALELVRARHLEYVDPSGYWTFDGLSDFSRIQRQDAFFRAVLAKLNTSLSLSNVLTINSFIGAAVGNMTIDDTLSRGDIFDLANTFKGLPSSHLITETLPTTGYTTDGGASVLKEAQPYADNMINAFNAIGQTTGTPNGASTTTTTTLAPSSISVQVFNASSASGVAHATGAGLTAAGFTVTQIGNAPSQLAAGSPSQIWYGPTGLDAAHAVGADLTGAFSYVPAPTLSGNSVAVLIAGTDLTVKPSATTTTTTSTSTTTTLAGSAEGSTGGATTSTTIPSDVYTNTQTEPWNPVPCTLGTPVTVPSGPAKRTATKK